MNAFNNLKVGKKILIGYIALLVLMGSIVAVLLFSLNNLTKDFTFLVEHDQPVLTNAHRLQTLVVDMETGERGFLITGNEEFLEPYYNAINEFDTLVEIEKQLVSDNPPQVAGLEKIIQLHDEWIQKAAKPEIAKRHEANKATVTATYLQEMLKGEIGKGILDKLRAVLAQMETNLMTKGDLESVILTLKIAKDMVEQETGQRGFIITGAENFLEPYQQGQAQLKADILALRPRLANDSENLTHLNQVELLSKQWLEKAGKPEIQARQEMNANPVTIADVSALIQSSIGKRILNKMRTQFVTFIQTENQLNAQRVKEVKQQVMLVEFLTLSLTLGAIVIGLLLGIFISRGITRPLDKLTNMANQMAVGNLNQIVEAQNRDKMSQILSRRDEMGDIGRSYDALANYFRTVIEDIVQISQGLAEGNLHIMPQAEYRGDFLPIKEALEATLSNQRLVIEDIIQVSQGLAKGNLRVIPQVTYRGNFLQIKEALETALTDLRYVIEDIVQVSQGLANGLSITSQTEYRGDFAQIQQALETAALRLTETMSQNAMQDWLKTGQNQLNDQMSGDQNIVELTHNIVSFLTLYLEAQVGICYLVEGTEHKHSMKLIASYAQTRRKNLAEEFQFSEGLVERAAKELKSIGSLVIYVVCNLLIIGHIFLAPKCPKIYVGTNAQH